MHASIILVLLALSSQQSSDAKAIEAAKNTNVHQIESSLPDKKFEQWLRDVAWAQAETQWEVNDCGEPSGDPALDKDRDFPMCAEAQVTLDGKRKLHVLLPVGTFKTGVRTGPASFFYAVIVALDGSQTWIERLSQLPEAIKPIK